MSLTAFLIKPRAPFHLGERGIGIEESANLVHSDTLFSACMSAWHALGETKEMAWDKVPPDDVPRLTSGFPFVEQNAYRVFFYPKPIGARVSMLGFEQYQEKKSRNSKAGKKVALLSHALFQIVAAGRAVTLVLPPADETKPSKWRETVAADSNALAVQSAQLGRVLMTFDEYEQIASLFSEQADPQARRLWLGSDEGGGLVPRVTVDRITSTSNIFFCGGVRFAPGCGLYFGVDGLADDCKRIEAALDYLAIEGLGGRRSQGYGQFEFERVAWQPPQIRQPTGYVTLSLYHPQASERDVFTDARSRYDLIQRRGWIYSAYTASYRRKQVAMLAEGALLPRIVRGDIVNVTPDQEKLPRPLPHQVYRYGLAFTVPVVLPAATAEEKG